MGYQRLIESNQNKRHKPFLKWPGGKRWLCPKLLEVISGFEYRRYFEPFLGGGALFFALRPTTAILSDVNPDLINLYRQVRRIPHRLIEDLRKIPVTDETYNALRAETACGKVRSAVRMLFLNRTGFAGMYRLNRNGEFNVPYGGGHRRHEILWKNNLILNAAEALRDAQLHCADFETVLGRARKGDLVYCDPTYTVAHNNNGFVRYNEANFRWADQVRLASACTRLRARGVTVLVSNAFHREIKSLYSDAVIYVAERASNLCPSAEKRRVTKEYLFVLRP